MAVLGIDYGPRKVGLAKAVDGAPPLPLDILENRGQEKLLAQLAERCRREGITEIVVGIPLTLRGESSSDGAAGVKRFAQILRQRTGLPVHLHDERLSTREAQRLLRGFRRQPDDAVAAMLVLQSWLDTRS